MIVDRSVLFWVILASCANKNDCEESYKNNSSTSTKSNSSGTKNWDYLIFTQIWPHSICHIANQRKAKSCRVPEGVSGWTIHGLWPTKYQGAAPKYCSKVHFDPNKIKDFESELEIHWPNLLTKEGVMSLWKHEWKKHGSCAQSLPTLSSEDKYFRQGLTQNNLHNLYKLFQNAKILPGNQSYPLDSFADATKKNVSKAVLFHCLTDTEKRWYISDVRICMDKKFSLIDCPTHSWNGVEIRGSPIPTELPCPRNQSLLYPLSLHHTVSSVIPSYFQINFLTTENLFCIVGLLVVFMAVAFYGFFGLKMRRKEKPNKYRILTNK